MRKKIVLLMVALLVIPFSGGLYASIKAKKKKEKTEASTPAKKTSAYDKLFKQGKTETVVGKFITLHRVNGKLYFEYPVKFLERELLIASTISETSNSQFCSVGYKPSDPLHVKFNLIDSTVYMREVNAITNYNEEEENLKEAVRKNFIDPFQRKFAVAAYNADSSAIVFEVTPLFNNEPKLEPISGGSMGFIKISASIKPDLTFNGKMKAFDDNVSIQSNMTHSCTASFLFFVIPLGDVSNVVTRTVLMLPEDRMKPRVSDSRIGIFLTAKQYISTEKDDVQRYTFANRWRLEPKDMEAWKRGELVEPIRPIVYYVDDAFPALWMASVKEGVLRWNQAFEKIGFKNAIQVRDFPKNDPSFDPDNLKYSCIRYLPSSTMNAMGPSWVDPSTGEIINASVIIYSNIIKLINQWRFTHTAQVDPRVRAQKMPDDVVKESVAYVVAHEVGHTLGLMHNMAASSAFPVDSLRSASFTQKYGTTPSIMDYARFNYVAQPGDKGVKLTPPDLGCYDEYAIKWLYSPIAGNLSVREEAKVLEGWVDEKAGNPYYRYGQQQVMARYDPSSIEEDLGDDPIKAGDYGIKNLKYLLEHISEWIEDDGSTAHRQGLYGSISDQYFRYVRNVMYNVGGIYLTEVKDGTPGKRFEAVDRETQKASLKWVVNQIRTCDWLDDQELISKFRLNIGYATKVREVLIGSLLSLDKNMLITSRVDKNGYSQKDYFDDLYAAVWESTMKGQKLTDGDRMLQKAVMMQVSASLNELKGSAKKLAGDNSLYAPSLREVAAYGLDETGMVARYIDQIEAMGAEQGVDVLSARVKLDQFGDTYGYGWQRALNLKSLDDAPAYQCVMVDKINRLLQSKVISAHKDDQAHYASILLLIKALSK